MNRVVITGIGLVSSLGQELSTVSEALRLGRCGLVHSPEREQLGFNCALKGALDEFDPRPWLSRRDRRSMGEPAQLAAVAALKALVDAGLERSDTRGPDVGVIIGNDSVCESAFSTARQTLAEGSTRRLGSGAVVKCMNSSPTINVGVMLGAQGAAWSVSAACASGAHSLGQAYGLLAMGQQQMVVCGGTQELHWSAMAGFDALNALSTWSGDPSGAVRPFSGDRCGLVPSGGSAMLILETREHALARGARIRAEVLGYGFSSDGHHVTSPTGEGAERAIRTALRQASLSPGDIDYINAHAAGTVSGDLAEGKAILGVFGDQGPPVSSTKGLTGHECWMAGASEVAYSLLMAQGGFLAPNANFEVVQPELAALDIVRSTRSVSPRLILSNSFGFGGTNAALVLRVDV